MGSESYRPFEHLQMDFIQFLSSLGYKYIVIFLCLFSGWVEAFLSQKVIALIVAKKLLDCVFSAWGIQIFTSSDPSTHFMGIIIK